MIKYRKHEVIKNIQLKRQAKCDKSHMKSVIQAYLDFIVTVIGNRTVSTLRCVTCTVGDVTFIHNLKTIKKIITIG